MNSSVNINCQNLLIIITGLPASGKSTLAAWLGQQLSIPVLSKDAIREILFDELGWSDRAWASKLGVATIQLMFHFATSQLNANGAVIMDNLFAPDVSTPQFNHLQEKTDAKIIQIVCQASFQTCFRRFEHRAIHENRHPGHGDTAVIQKWRKDPLENKSLAMPLKGDLILVNTETFANVNYQSILNQILELTLKNTGD
ncbi:MAG: ATP-binding protein [Chloroflexota bacterium]